MTKIVEPEGERVSVNAAASQSPFRDDTQRVYSVRCVSETLIAALFLVSFSNGIHNSMIHVSAKSIGSNVYSSLSFIHYAHSIHN